MGQPPRQGAGKASGEQVYSAVMLGRMPGTQELAVGGVRTFESNDMAERWNEEEGELRGDRHLLPAQPPLYGRQPRSASLASSAQ